MALFQVLPSVIKTTNRWSCYWSKRYSEACKGFLVNSCVLMGLKGSFLLIPALAGRSSRAKTRLKAGIGSSSQQLVLKTMGRLFLSRAVHSFNVHCLLFIRLMPRSALGEHEALCCCTRQPHTDVPPQEHGKNPKKWPFTDQFLLKSSELPGSLLWSLTSVCCVPRVRRAFRLLNFGFCPGLAQQWF